MYNVLPDLNPPSQLLALPVELWSNILRMLDPLSLLTAVRACPAWKRFSEEDSVLRKTLKSAGKLEVKMARRIIHGKCTRIDPNRIDDSSMNRFGSLPIYMNPVEILTRPKKTTSRKDPACILDKKFFHCRI